MTHRPKPLRAMLNPFLQLSRKVGVSIPFLIAVKISLENICTSYSSAYKAKKRFRPRSAQELSKSVEDKTEYCPARIAIFLQPVPNHHLLEKMRQNYRSCLVSLPTIKRSFYVFLFERKSERYSIVNCTFNSNYLILRSKTIPIPSILPVKYSAPP